MSFLKHWCPVPKGWYNMRFVGIFLVSLLPALLGFSMASRLSRRIAVLNELKLLISEIKEQIRYSSREICPLLKMIGGKGCYSNLLFLNELTDDGVWNPRLKDDDLLSCGLCKEDLSAVKNFFLGLGTSDTEGQISHCELYFAELTKMAGEAERLQSDKGRLYRTLGMIGGIGVAIMLI